MKFKVKKGRLNTALSLYILVYTLSSLLFIFDFLSLLSSIRIFVAIRMIPLLKTASCKAWIVSKRGIFRKPEVHWVSVDPKELRKVQINERPEEGIAEA